MTDTHADADAHADAHGGPKHPYHLVDPSPWPIVGAIASGMLASGGVLYMHGHGWALMAIGLICVLGTMAVWWRDVIREATFQGFHTPVVQLGLRYGMALFIASEVMFFSASAPPRSRPMNTATPPSISPRGSIPRPSSWRPAFTAFT